jgi:Zn-dependent M28 family amino/carboxypeptidase
MRLIYALATSLLLIMLLVAMVSAQEAWRLVMVSYAGWDQLQELASWGLQIINYQGKVLAALSYDEQIERLRQAGFEVRILDMAANPDSYYLAYPPQGRDEVSGSDLAVYPYAAGVYIIKANPVAAEALTSQAIQIVKLPRSVTLDCSKQASAGSQGNLAYSPDIQEMVDAVSSTLLIHHVCKLQDDDSQAYCNELGTRYSFAAAQLDQAAQYLSSQYAALSLTVTYDPFVLNGYSMTNLAAELPGVGPDRDHIYILCAHYDSISRNPSSVAPGADDNASGSAAVLEAARILAQHRFNRTIRFVHFAGEEQGLIGSAHYAAAAAQRGDLIDGVINLDMIGYESVPPNDHSVEVHAGVDPASIALADALVSNITEYGLLLVPETITSSATSRSDHASFWNQGYPAILAIEDFQDFNPYYHSASDTLANMHTPMMVEYTKACVATLAGLAADIRVTSFSIYVPYFGSAPVSNATP